MKPNHKIGSPSFIISLLIIAGFLLWGAFRVVLSGHRQDPNRTRCVNALRLIDLAKQVLAIQNNWTNGYVIADSPAAIWTVLAPLTGNTNILCCPDLPVGTHYIYGPIGITPKCKYGKDHVFNQD